MGTEASPEDFRFTAARVAAQQILERLESRPDADLPERLSIIVFRVFDAISDSEWRRDEPAQVPDRHPARKISAPGWTITAIWLARAQ